MNTDSNIRISDITNMNGEFKFHFHIHFEILYFHSGSAKIFSDGFEVTMNQGSYCIIPPFCPHKSIYSDCHITKIIFPLSYIDRYLTEETTKTLHTYYSKRISINLKPHYDTMASLVQDLSSGITGGAFIYIYKLLKNCVSIPFVAPNHDRLADIMTYIGAYSFGKIMLDEVADSCNVSKYHICRLFKSKLGITPVEYITFARIRRAVAKLLYTNHTIARISSDLGFYSPNYFTTLFKNYFGMLPSELRKNVDNPSEERYYLARAQQNSD